MTTRIRRGKEVEIPPEWEGQVTRRQTIRKRLSKTTRKVRRRMKWRYGAGRTPEAQEARAPKAEEWD